MFKQTSIIGLTLQVCENFLTLHSGLLLDFYITSISVGSVVVIDYEIPVSIVFLLYIIDNRKFPSALCFFCR